ncbi:zinc-binding alcohol dehydrogenase family protein [Enterococcus faecalis]|uniref:alcohol dehydrogenase catalytic domain-containing protein n=1 Tax=Enterococcus TaxID=1350 RepID=UPI00103BD8AB|nr:zinc-binding alcohol dehydrogenase family protein [Enterococcus faecalis]EGO5824508.1 zinc-binding alcohol dehydrogenase family protein [Enterococcus faecalis]EGO6732057.1 zinc-binding alcohol dehydrogenase family protein [Enterococcus faecalis]EGS1177054.1 zinc-binding alcohol dehydrogenase family protein [Enterococcus faecalis]EIA0405854.1 zinc-binding alcohol dehydrogenase family protein [Enterococcus faecalis]EJA1042705.1 zinc-binding alcohol dehydrogenase family protein [Enterococcus f
MKALVAINPRYKNSLEFKKMETVKFGSTNVLFGLVELNQPDFDINNLQNDDYILIKVKYFSCNYRDKSILLEAYTSEKNENRLFFPFGSEFSAEIIKIGKNVNNFNVGDFVMPNCEYPHGVKPGIPSNFASLGWLKIHKSKVIKIPARLSLEEAACFSLGSQTASSMIRRSNILKESGNPVVFSARSATSMFIIRQLLIQGITPICISTTSWTDFEKEYIYPCEVERLEDVSLQAMKRNITHVFDPFFDLNVENAVNLLQIGGTYITCGLLNQHPLLSEKIPIENEPILRRALSMGVMKNITFIGNCLGTYEDLQNAISLEERFSVNPVIDKSYNVNQYLDFIDRSFFNANKIGKVSLTYH